VDGWGVEVVRWKVVRVDGEVGKWIAGWLLFICFNELFW
jgi:hypothetical protein